MATLWESPAPKRKKMAHAPDDPFADDYALSDSLSPSR